MFVCLLLISDNYDDNIPIDQDMISKYLRMIQAVSESYYREYADPLAHFLLRCAPVVTAEINSGWGQESLKGPESFPPIPKRNLKCSPSQGQNENDPADPSGGHIASGYTSVEIRLKYSLGDSLAKSH